MQLVLGVACGLSLTCFAFFAHLHVLVLVYPLVFTAAFSGGAYMAIKSTLIMTNVDPSVSGRVMGVYMLIQSIGSGR